MVGFIEVNGLDAPKGFAVVAAIDALRRMDEVLFRKRVENGFGMEERNSTPARGKGALTPLRSVWSFPTPEWAAQAPWCSFAGGFAGFAGVGAKPATVPVSSPTKNALCLCLRQRGKERILELPGCPQEKAKSASSQGFGKSDLSKAGELEWEC